MAATIYFSGSITGGRDDVHLYRRFIETLEKAGHRVLAGAVASETTGPAGEAGGVRAIFSRDFGWLNEADLLVAEVSTPSHGVGYEIAAARYLFGIPVVALFRPAKTRRCSAMIAGDPGIRLIGYTDATVADAARELLAAVAEIRP